MHRGVSAGQPQAFRRINTQGYHYAVLVEDNCTGCTNCALVCPDAVITVYRETKKTRVPVARITNVTENITVTRSTKEIARCDDIRLMKGNEALAEAAIRAGCQAYFGYPITPQSEILEYLADEGRKRGMIVLQAESEVASINMVYGAAGAGARVMTSSSSPGVSLMQEGISYIACAELPCLIVNVSRGGPGLGTIQPVAGRLLPGGEGRRSRRLPAHRPGTIQRAGNGGLRL